MLEYLDNKAVFVSIQEEWEEANMRGFARQ